MREIQNEFEELKLTHIRIFDQRERSSLADFFAIATAESFTQIESIRYRLIRLMKEKGYGLRNPNESYRGGWLIMDFGDFVVHVFTEEARAFYQLDRFLESGEINIENAEDFVRI